MLQGHKVSQWISEHLILKVDQERNVNDIIRCPGTNKCLYRKPSKTGMTQFGMQNSNSMLVKQLVSKTSTRWLEGTRYVNAHRILLKAGQISAVFFKRRIQLLGVIQGLPNLRCVFWPMWTAIPETEIKCSSDCFLYTVRNQLKVKLTDLIFVHWREKCALGLFSLGKQKLVIQSVQL